MMGQKSKLSSIVEEKEGIEIELELAEVTLTAVDLRSLSRPSDIANGDAFSTLMRLHRYACTREDKTGYLLRLIRTSKAEQS